MTPTRRILTLAAIAALTGCADPKEPEVATASADAATSPSSALPRSFETYVRTSEAWQEALTTLLEVAPGDGQVDEDYLDEVEAMLSDVETKFTAWWSIADWAAEMAGEDIERSVRRYAATYRRWDEIQRRFLAGYRECLPIAGSGEDTLACLKAQGLGPALREHFTLTDQLRSQTGVMIELLMFSPAFQETEAAAS